MRSRQIFTSVLLIIVILAAFSLAVAAARSARRQNVAEAERLTHGHAANAPDEIRKYGCYSCHTIAGVPGAVGLVGPPLNGIAERVYIAGHVPNTPANITQWIQHPRSIDPHTAMPEMGVTEQDSRDIAAYLYSQR
jgi:cytochrome c2